MDLEELQSARSRERRTDSLQPLSDSFYGEASAFVRELRAERKRVAATADDPFDSPDVRRLTNSIKTAENTIEAIYERRVGKVVKLASLEAAGMSTDDDGLTPEERDLFVTLVDAIERNRANVVEDLAGEASPDVGGDGSEPGVDPTGRATPTDSNAANAETSVRNADDPPGPTARDPDTSTSDEGRRGAEEVGGGEATDAAERTTSGGAADDTADPTPTADAPSAADAMGAPAGAVGGGSRDRDPDAPPVSADGAGASVETRSGGDADPDDDRRTDTNHPGDVERATVRITRDVGEIVGVDERVYDLAAEDIVTLPTANAEPLVERDAAERLESNDRA